jgi:hypothetical protein
LAGRETKHNFYQDESHEGKCSKRNYVGIGLIVNAVENNLLLVQW